MALPAPVSETAKDVILRLVQDQPEDSSFDEILRELVFARAIERGLADVEAGRVISDEEMGDFIESL